MRGNNSNFVATALRRLAQYTDDRFLREYVTLGAATVESAAAAAGEEPPGNLGDLRARIDAILQSEALPAPGQK